MPRDRNHLHHKLLRDSRRTRCKNRRRSSRATNMHGSLQRRNREKRVHKRRKTSRRIQQRSRGQCHVETLPKTPFRTTATVRNEGTRPCEERRHETANLGSSANRKDRAGKSNELQR